jgi:phosphotriesterase-related protein
MPIITVNGPIDKRDIGFTLPHEHLFLDISFIRQSNKSEKSIIELSDLHVLRRDFSALETNLKLNDEQLIKSELEIFRDSGGKTMIDQSSIGAGRKPELLKNISNSTGINIILSTGYYLKESLSNEIVNEDEKELINNMTSEIKNGIGKNKIFPGSIGEIGIGPVIGSWEKKLLRASVKVQKQTGLPLFIHIQAVPTLKTVSNELNGIEVLEFLEKENAVMDKVVICHVDAKLNEKYIKELLDRNVYVEFDHFGKEYYFLEKDFLMSRDIERVDIIKELISEGHANKILISQDVCMKTDLISYGGNGYSYIIERIIPIMRKRGIKQQDISIITEKNPSNLLEVKKDFMDFGS